MSNMLDLKPTEYILPTAIEFVISPSYLERFYDLLDECHVHIDNFCNHFTSSTILLIDPYFDTYKNEVRYKIYTPYICLKCGLTGDLDTIMVLSAFKMTLKSKNDALKNAKNVKCNTIILKYSDIIYENGYKVSYVGNLKFKKSGEYIRKYLKVADRNNDNENEVVPKLNTKFERLLEQAENYSILSNDLEFNKINSVGDIYYNKIESVEYERTDRQAYKFIFNELNDSLIVGTRVDIHDKKDNIQSAEILEVLKDENAIIVLFNKEISVSDFPIMGTMTLSFSTVNKDVQLNAINALREGKAEAKYLENVLGKNKTSGFENKDLTEVKEALSQKKYPPNDSQMLAIEKGINTKDVLLVMGPPGTGKTTVIVEWVKYFVNKEHKRVLISSQNNKAVDNVIERLIEEKDIDIIRVGSETKIENSIKPYMFENKIKTIRDDIYKKTEDSLMQTENALHDLSDIFSETTNLKNIDSRVREEEKQLVVYIQEKIKPVIDEINDIKKIDIKLNNKVHKFEKWTLKLIKFIDMLRSKTGFISYLLIPLIFIMKFIINILIKQYDKYIEQNHLNIDKYYTKINLLNSYQSEYDSMFDDFYIDYEVRDTQITKVISLIDLNECAKKYLSSQREDYLDLNKFNQIANGIFKEHNKFNVIKDIIVEWRDMVKNDQNYAFDQLVLESVDLVGATCIGINSQKKFSELDFDITIIDEAGQIQIHNALVPMSVSNKLIMLGDSKQIPPMADPELVEECENNQINSNLLKESLFKDMYDKLPSENKMMLDTQYRMPGEIADIISKHFYNGEYISPAFKYNTPSIFPMLSNKTLLLIDTSKSKDRLETKLEVGCYNNLEANVIHRIIERISNEEIDFNQIGIISAYGDQVKRIIKKVKKIIPEDIVNEMAATLDSFQGQERDLIIYSFTRSNLRNPQKARIGFLKELRRLNVAMSRCKKMLILIGDFDFLVSCELAEYDEYDQEVDQDERKFSIFIKFLLDSVKNGSGEIIDVDDFIKRLEV